MSSVFNLVAKLFNLIFAGSGTPLIQRLINFVTSEPYVFLGVILVIIGFSIGILYRIIHA